MKKTVCVIMSALLLLSGCGMTNSRQIKNILAENEWTESEQTENGRSESKPSRTAITTTYSEYGISFEVLGSTLTVSGNFDDGLHNYLMVAFDRDFDNCETAEALNGSFAITARIPDKNSTMPELYAGVEKYGQYEGVVSDFIRLKKTDDNWEIVPSPVYENNVELFNKSKSPEDFLSPTKDIQSEDTQIKRLSDDIVFGISDDYEKAWAIHDWVAENIFYDYDAFTSGSYTNNDMDAKTVLATKRSVCEGFANLMAALLRAQNIPCRIQGGYALGVGTSSEWTPSGINSNEENHAWNEVFVNNHWILVDATWDTENKYTNGQYTKGSAVSSIYFDSTMEFFSMSHKAIENQMRFNTAY